jgi:hypothetical protein
MVAIARAMKWLLAVVVAGCAHPPAAPPIADEVAAPTACTTRGPILFEDRGADDRYDLVLYATGAWTMDGAEVQGEGCLHTDALTPLAAELDHATWHVDAGMPDCAALSRPQATYLLRGRVVYHKVMCGGSLDDASADAVGHVEEQIEAQRTGSGSGSAGSSQPP